MHALQQYGVERRIARDGREYTQAEFRSFYGEEWGEYYWDLARTGGAPQPGGAGAPQAADIDAVPPGDGWGPNTEAVEAGKAARFAQYLVEIGLGSESIAKVILSTGRFDPEWIKENATGDGAGSVQ